MLLSFLLSLCSEADAFIGSSPSLEFWLSSRFSLSGYRTYAGRQEPLDDEELSDQSLYCPIH